MLKDMKMQTSSIIFPFFSLQNNDELSKESCKQRSCTFPFTKSRVNDKSFGG